MTSPPPFSSASASRIQSQVQGKNFVIADGQFNQWNVDNSITNISALQDAKARASERASERAFEKLQKAVATSAFHNSAQRVDSPKCHPNTRTAVLKRIMGWVMSRDDRDAWIMWLYGAAGAGKSAIVQSIAERCVKLGIPVASFFFFRTDPTRNNIRPLMVTLAYQLANIIPASRDFIIQSITDDPLIFEKSLELQLESLILNPLRQIGQLCLSSESPNSTPLLILIDGLDECNDRSMQTDLIRTLANISANNDLALTFLIASRPESHLSMTFNSRMCAVILTRLALDNKYLPDFDIRLFLEDKFAEIRDIHPLKHLLGTAWPPRSNIDEIVEKSSGQFIYASVIINYTSSPAGHPAHRLEICRGLRPAHADTPFAQLDVLYQHIFSQVQNLDTTRPLLAMALYGNDTTRNPFLDVQEPGRLETCFSDLSSVISCSGNKVKFLHASLPDFLRDPERSKENYMDPGVWCAYLAVLVFRDSKIQDNFQALVTANLVIRASPTPELQTELVRFVPKRFLLGQSGFVTRLIVLGLLSAVRTLNFNDGGKTYRRVFSKLARYIKTHWHDTYHELKVIRPMSPTMQWFRSVFSVVIDGWSSLGIGEKKPEMKNVSWGLIEHDKYMDANFKRDEVIAKKRASTSSIGD